MVPIEGMAGSRLMAVTLSPSLTRVTISCAVTGHQAEGRPSRSRWPSARARAKTFPKAGRSRAQARRVAVDGMAGSAQIDRCVSPACTRRQTSRATLAERRT